MTRPALDDLGAIVREAALAAGVRPDELDAPLRCEAGCGVEVRPGARLCAACGTKRAAAEHTEAVKKAWHTVPMSLRWAGLDSPKLAQWVRDEAAIARVRQLAADLAGNPIVTLCGPAGAGKTTLACALLRQWVRLGASPSAPPAMRLMARRARFAAVQDLLHDRAETRLGEHVVSIDLARQASVLVLDEVGRGKDPQGVIFGLLHARHRERRPTIMTTPFASASELAADARDGGLARRVFDDGQRVDVKKLTP